MICLLLKPLGEEAIDSCPTGLKKPDWVGDKISHSGHVANTDEPQPEKKVKVDINTSTSSSSAIYSSGHIFSPRDSGITQGITTSGSSSIHMPTSKVDSSAMQPDKELSMDQSTIRNLKSGEEASNTVSSSEYGYHSQMCITTVLGNIEYKKREILKGYSTSSSDDLDTKRKYTIAPHMHLQKPCPKKDSTSPRERREHRRQRLILRSNSNRRIVNSLVHYIPTDTDIDECLMEFTVDFLLNGFSDLVETYRQTLLRDEAEQPQFQTDRTQFLWLIEYFLKFAAQLEVEVEQIG